MVMSMTGYGNHTVKSEEMTISAEVRTVNSRYLDFSPKIPQSFNFLEGDIKAIIQQYFHRGRIEVFLFVSGQQLEQKTIQVNWDLIDEYVAQLKKAQKRYDLSESLPVTMLTQVDGLLTIDEQEHDYAHIKAPILEAIKHACEKVCDVRNKEGLFLFEDIQKRLDNINNMLKLLKESQHEIIELYRKRIENRIEQYLKEKHIVESERLYQEVALLAEKGDITEEITRLFSHIKQFKLISANKGPVGRQLDFIVQEMHREANTIGAKSVDTSTSKSVVMMKSDIDKIKEQVQNIE